MWYKNVYTIRIGSLSAICNANSDWIFFICYRAELLLIEVTIINGTLADSGQRDCIESRWIFESWLPFVYERKNHWFHVGDKVQQIGCAIRYRQRSSSSLCIVADRSIWKKGNRRMSHWEKRLKSSIWVTMYGAQAFDDNRANQYSLYLFFYCWPPKINRRCLIYIYHMEKVLLR